jgi:hypothetical protein
MVDGTGSGKERGTVERRKRDKTLGRGGCPFDIFVAERLI